MGDWRRAGAKHNSHWDVNHGTGVDIEELRGEEQGQRQGHGQGRGVVGFQFVGGEIDGMTGHRIGDATMDVQVTHFGGFD